MQASISAFTIDKSQIECEDHNSGDHVPSALYDHLELDVSCFSLIDHTKKQTSKTSAQPLFCDLTYYFD